MGQGTRSVRPGPACGCGRRSPVPWTLERSMPCSSAMRLTTGEWKPERSVVALLRAARPEAVPPGAPQDGPRPGGRWRRALREAFPRRTVSPGSTTSRSIRPLAGDGISTSILSVVTWRSSHRASIGSPGLLAPLDDRALGDADPHLGHDDRRRLARVMAAPREPVFAGRASWSVLEEFTARLLHVVELGKDRLLERRAERDRDVGCGQPAHRAVEVLERLAPRRGCHLGARRRTTASPRAPSAPFRSFGRS